MFFGDIFTLLLQSILFWTSRKEIKLIQYKMDQKILWAVNKMPKTDDKNLPIMGLEEIKKARTFHESFPQYSETPLTKLPHMASYLGVKEVYVKDESYRFGLNAFKVLGGSFAMARYIAKETGKDVSELPYSVLTSEQLRKEFDRLLSLQQQTATTAAVLHGLLTVLDRRQLFICLRELLRPVFRISQKKALR